jgi:hypothetical protein
MPRCFVGSSRLPAFSSLRLGKAWFPPFCGRSDGRFAWRVRRATGDICKKSCCEQDREFRSPHCSVHTFVLFPRGPF